MAKDKIKGTRVESAKERSTPVMGAPQHVSAKLEKTRVKKGPGLPRKNEPQASSMKSAMSRMGLKMGTRCTSKDTGHK